jgi:hypothetical protein
MIVCAHDAGHGEPAMHFPHVGLRVPGRQLGAHRLDQRAFDRDVDAALHLRRLELNGGDVLQDQHGRHASTGLSR